MIQGQEVETAELTPQEITNHLLLSSLKQAMRIIEDQAVEIERLRRINDETDATLNKILVIAEAANNTSAY